MKILSYRRFALWWQLAMDWFQRQFAAIAASIDFTPVEEKLDDVKSDVADVKTAVENIDFTELAKDSTVAKQGTNPNATNTAILAAFGNIDFSTLAKQGTDPTATLTAIKELLAGDDAPEELPEGVGDRLLLLLQHFGIAGSYEAEAKGGERTNNTVIDECKVRFQDAFNGLLPTGFTMPNSVTVDNLTYTGTTNS